MKKIIAGLLVSVAAQAGGTRTVQYFANNNRDCDVEVTTERDSRFGGYTTTILRLIKFSKDQNQGSALEGTLVLHRYDSPLIAEDSSLGGCWSQKNFFKRSSSEIPGAISQNFECRNGLDFYELSYFVNHLGAVESVRYTHSVGPFVKFTVGNECANMKLVE